MAPVVTSEATGLLPALAFSHLSFLLLKLGTMFERQRHYTESNLGGR